MHSFTVDCKHSLRGALVSYVCTSVTEDEGCVNDVITFFDEMPVSYTHLDVYKRQLYGSKCNF